ncbi:MAG: ABC transporter substrate-binding protein [Candidatus Sumerlaeaceae bacterium]
MNRVLPIAALVFALIFFFVTERSSYFATENAAGPEAIHFWAASTPAQTMEELKADFENQHPEYRVEIQTVAWNSLQEKTLWAVAANSNVPDLIVGSSEWTGGLANNGALEPFDNHFPPDFFKQFFPSALGTYQFPEVFKDQPGSRGRMRQYGIPLDLDMMLMFYRSDIVDPVMASLGMKAFPSTWSDLSKLGQALFNAQGALPSSVQLLYLDPEDPVPLRMAFLPSSGGVLFNKEMTRATFDSAESQAAFSFFAELLGNRSAKMWNRSTMGDPFDLVKSGRVAGNIAGPWYGKLLEQRAPEQAGKWRVALFPRRSPELPSCGVGGSCLAMPYNAPNKRGAIELARYMSTNKFAMAYFRRVGSPPPQITAWNEAVFDEPSSYFGGQTVYAVVRQAIDQSHPLQLLPNAEIVKSHVRWALSEISRGKSDAHQVLSKAVVDANEVLAQR